MVQVAHMADADAQSLLPELRGDLQLDEGAPGADGSPAWVIQDPISNTFFRIGWLEFEFLSRWHLNRANDVIAAVSTQTPLRPTMDELLELKQFLFTNGLLQAHSTELTSQLVEMARKTRGSLLMAFVKNYLFFRVPLIHPELVLRRIYPRLAWIYSARTAWSVFALCLAGLILVFQQSDIFVASFIDSFSPQGVIFYLVALAFAKSLHEFAHALTATRFGLRVAHMGVAFLVLWPMLYTDTGESWRLRDRRQRLAISSAGIISELLLAGLATLAWGLCAPGDLKTALFYLAGTSWVLSLAINASPLMRFDGYFILSDLLDFPNLHERSFAFARTALRKSLLGWDETWPEDFPALKRRLLILFGFAVWIYRFLIFTAIAVAVYLMFTKLLGIILFCIEIFWFILKPISSEMQIWRERKSEISDRAKRRLAYILAGVVLFGFIPWDRQVRAIGFDHGGNTFAFYAPMGAMLQGAPPEAGFVRKGTTVFTLNHPDLEYRTTLALLASASVDGELRGLLSLPNGEQKRGILTEQLQLAKAQFDAGNAEQARVRLTAPFDGVLVDIVPELGDGVWVNSKQPLAYLVDHSSWQVDAYVGQTDIDRIKPGARARYYSERDPGTVLEGTVDLVEDTRVDELPHQALAAKYGGEIKIRELEGDLQPETPLFRIRIRLESEPKQLQVGTGYAVIEAMPESIFGDYISHFVSVIVRQVGF